MKFKSEAVVQSFARIIDAAKANVIVIDLNTDDIRDLEIKKLIYQLHNTVLLMTKALFELHSVYEDMLITYKMAQRYPWRMTQIRKAEHLRLVWFQFVNLCYLFEEKTKLFHNQYACCLRIFSDGTERISLRMRNKQIKACLGGYIKARGQTFHEWYANHQAVHNFNLIEFISILSPEATLDVDGHYREAKFMLSIDIRQAITFMEQFLIDLADAESDKIIELIKKYDDFLLWARNDK